MAFALAGSLSSPSVISLKIAIAFATEGDKICLLIVEVLVCAAAGALAHSKKQRDWNPRNAVLLPPFLTEAAILQGESDADDLLKIFARSITEWAKEDETTNEAYKANNDDSVVTIEAEDAKSKPSKAKLAAAETFTTIADDCDDVLVFLQAIAVKYPRFIAAPLSFRAD